MLLSKKYKEGSDFLTRSLLAIANSQNIISDFSVGIFLAFLSIGFIYCYTNRDVGKRQQLEMELEQERKYISTILNTASALVGVKVAKLHLSAT